eukprot:6313297-Prymnesium_polylepis.1
MVHASRAGGPAGQADVCGELLSSGPSVAQRLVASNACAVQAGGRSSDIRCPTKCIDVLAQYFEDGEWDESDVPPDTVALSTRDESRCGWTSSTRLRRSSIQQEDISKPDRTRFVRWLAAREQEDEDAPQYRPSHEIPRPR